MINGKCVNLCLGDDDNLNKKETITTKYLGLIARQKWKRSKSKSIILSNHKSILENRRCLFRFFSRKFFYQSNRFFSFRMWWDRYQEKFFCFWSNKMKTKHNFYVRIFLCCFFLFCIFVCSGKASFFLSIDSRYCVKIFVFFRKSISKTYTDTMLSLLFAYSEKFFFRQKHKSYRYIPIEFERK